MTMRPSRSSGGGNGNDSNGFSALQHDNDKRVDHQSIKPLLIQNTNLVEPSSDDQQLLVERIQSSSCSAVATAGTPSSPRSIRSGISSVSHGVPFVHQLGRDPTGWCVLGGGPIPAGLSHSFTGNSDLSIQCSIPSGSPYSPTTRTVPLLKHPSSALSERSFHSSIAVAVGDSLPRDEELTTVDDEESSNCCEHQSDDNMELNTLMINDHQTRTPVHLGRAKSEETGSVMGGRKAFESSNYVDNLDELGDFQVRVESQDFRFSCGHFVAYDGYRERLHGHTYTVKMRVGGRLNSDGYVLDFNLCKRILRETCKKFNEFMIIPMKSDVLVIKNENRSINIITQDGAKFMFPESDCLCLPIMHSTAEELAAHFWSEALQLFTPQYLQDRGVRWLEITIAERPTQEAQYRRHIPVPPPL